MRAVLCVVLVVSVLGCSNAKRPEPGAPDATAACDTGTRRCEGNTFEVCVDGAWDVVEQCPLFCSLDGCASCEGDNCVSDSCMQSSMDASYIGCEYWAVDLDNAVEVFAKPLEGQPGNECVLWPSSKQMLTPIRVCYDGSYALAGRCDTPNDGCPTGFSCTDSPSTAIPIGICALDGEHAPYAIVVSNPQSYDVAVTIENAAAMTMTLVVAPSDVKAIYPQQIGFPDQSVDGTSKAARAYRVTSTAPVVAYQFNPLNNVDVFSNDASLLIPSAGFGSKYVAVSYPTLTRRGPNTPGRDNYNGYITIVAWQDDTQIEITPSANTLAGADGTPALLANQPRAFTLDKYDVLNLESEAGPDPFTADGLNGGDLTGTTIKALNSKTIGVFGGHEAVKIAAPNSDCCADHLEEMMFPTSTWGKHFAVARTVARRDSPDIVRVVAMEPNTQVTMAPQPIGGPCPVLQPGQHCDVRIMQATTVDSTQPITVAHLLMSTIQGQTGIGDPSLGIVPPFEQYRDSYKFLAPMNYAEQYVSLIAKQGDDVRLDNTAVTGWTPFAAGLMTASAPLSVGTHTISCPLECSVEVYGWSSAVSYLFAGGLNLHTIVIQHD
jgi:hypothetical protein